MFGFTFWILAELFSNVNCGNCPVPDNMYENYVNSHSNVAVINYHNSTTDPQDPFYLASLPASQQRDVFYGGSGGLSDPTAYIDGVFAGSTEGTWETYSNAAVGKAIPITPIVSHGPAGIDTITFSVTGASPIQVNAYVAITESQIYFGNNKSYGNPPDSLWNNIFRTMLIPAGGTNFNLNGTNTFSVIYDSSAQRFAGNLQNMQAVVFVQDVSPTTPSNNNSHQVEAIGVVSLGSPSAVTAQNASATRLIIPDNPLSPQGEFRLELASPGHVQVTVYDMLGRKIRTLVDGTMPAGETTVDMNGTTLPSGAYLAQLSVDGLVVDQQKFVSP